MFVEENSDQHLIADIQEWSVLLQKKKKKKLLT